MAPRSLRNGCPAGGPRSPPTLPTVRLGASEHGRFPQVLSALRHFGSGGGGQGPARQGLRHSTGLGGPGRATVGWAGLGGRAQNWDGLASNRALDPPPAPRPAAGRSRSAPLTLRKSSGGAGAAHAQEAGRKRHTRHTGRRRQNRDQDGGARGEEGKLRVREARSAGSRVQVTVPQRRARARARGSPPVRPTALTADCLCFSSRSPSGGLCLRCLQPCAFRSSPGPLRSSGCPRRSPSQAAVPAAR